MSEHLKGPWTVDHVTLDASEGMDIILGYDTPELGSPVVLASLHFDEDDRPFTKQQVIEQGRLMAKAPTLAAKVQRLRAVLAELEWSVRAEGMEDVDDNPYWNFCPMCARVKADGHSPDCRLKAALDA